MSVNIGERLREVRKNMNLSQEDMGKLGGVKPQAQGNYEKGVRVPDAQYLELLAGHGVDVSYILLGTQRKLSDMSAAEIAEVDSHIEVRTSHAAIRQSVPHGKKAGGDVMRERILANAIAVQEAQIIYVPLYSQPVAGGGGAVVQANQLEIDLFPVYVDPRAKPLNVPALKAMPVTGNSMDGALSAGDIVVVDTSQNDPTTIKSGHIYVLWMGEDLIVKYVQRLANGDLQACSHNNSLPPVTLHRRDLQDNLVGVVGRVVVSGKRWT